MRSIGKLVSVSFPMLLLTFALLEFVVLRSWVAVDDIPIEEYDDVHQMIRYRPDQQGICYPDRDLRHPVPFTVNDDGWNSVHPYYAAPRDGKLRVAVVGDSYVAAFEVAPRESIAAQLESLLAPNKAEIYGFGMRGAPLSQYLHIARDVVARYKPDAVVVLIVHNDLDESYRIVPGRYTHSFLHLVVDGEDVKEIPPVRYEPSRFATWVRTRSALFRFLFYRLQVGAQLLRRLYARLAGAPVRYEANVDTSQLTEEKARLGMVASYVFRQFAELERSTGARFILMMDAPRDSIYRGEDASQSEAALLNGIVRRSAEESGVTFIDLTQRFTLEYRKHHERFEFPGDGHWNAVAHRIAAQEACTALSRMLTAVDCAETRQR